MHDTQYADEVPVYSAFFQEYDPDEVEVLPELKIGLYARISDANDPLGVNRQIGIGETQALLNPMLLAAKRNAVIVDRYVDNNITAYDLTKERPDFRRMINDLRSGRINAVWGVDFDRIARDPEESEMLRGTMTRHNGQMILTVTPGDNFDVVSGEGRLNWRMKTMVAAEEVENTKKRSKRQRVEKVKKGGFNGGKRRYGYTADMSAIVPEEAKIIQEVAERMLNLESLTSIAKDLNSRGVPTALKHSKKIDVNTGEVTYPYANSKWQGTNLQRAACGPHVAGFRVAYGGIARQKAAWPKILDETTWHRLQTLINSNKHRGKGAEVPKKRFSPLSGMLICGKLKTDGSICGAKLRVQKLSQTKRPGDERRYWQCNSPEGCHGVNRSDAKLSKWILGDILAAYATPGFVQRRITASAQSETDDRENVWELLQTERAALRQTHLDARNPAMGIEREDYMAWVAEHVRKIADYERRLQAISDRQEIDVELLLSGRLDEEWPNLPLEKQARIVSFAVRDITVRPVANGGRWNNNPHDHYRINWIDNPGSALPDLLLAQ